ncbi:hypothetical protein GGU10DRAFT_363033 [Lentinula aff. detonsa]|uniref:Uncharacterized protein n=1 Tax=Lentinula aff. detonsa TaxID=2804958 RepID=A0AA38L417_9AGAR|nr:hypothetical protein GGU10DRAFT_363033 [Lentinula aff. detonsa]
MAASTEAAARPNSQCIAEHFCTPGNEAVLDPEADHTGTLTPKKKKKKKSKKSATTKAKEAAAKKTAESAEAEGRPSVLCISRNKHWKYISSYHGPWLQLPVELLESLFVLNIDPTTLTVPQPIPQAFGSSRIPITYNGTPTLKLRDRGLESLKSEPDSPGGGRFTGHDHYMLPAATQLSPPAPLPSLKPGTAPPPPIDPGVFKNVTSIRRLIDEAAELSVRASSGMSAAELASPGVLGSMSGYAYNGGTWAAAQTLGINHLGGNGGRNVAMSAMRIHRLRALAVQKLAQAYKADEIASSVMVMQGGSVFDDVAEKVLKVDPNDVDARYVHFFHERIPSRQLAESTTTQVLDELIAAQPQRLEFYRTRGVVHCFRDEYAQAIKDFTHALKEARAARKVRAMGHDHKDHSNSGGKSSMRREHASRGAGAGGKKKRSRNIGAGGRRTNGQAPPDGTSAAVEHGDEETSGEGGSATGDVGDLLLPLHPSALPEAPDPIEPQLLFLRGSAYLQQAIRSIELAVLDTEGLDENARPKEGILKSKLHYLNNFSPSHHVFDSSELRLSFLQESLYGGVETGNPAGPLGSSDGPKVKAYRKVLAAEGFRAQVISCIKKSIRDHERFLGHFDTLEADPSHEKGKGGTGREDLKEQTEYAFRLSESTRPGNYTASSGSSTPYADHVPPPVTMFTTYHPLLVESHYMILLALLMLGDFSRILPTFIRTAALVDGLEGYPVFLPPRSMAQAEFIEVLERLASAWKKGHFEDEYALVPVRNRNGTNAPSSIPVSRATSTYSPASTSGSSSPATTTTDLYDDILGTAPSESSATDVGEGGSSSSSEPGCSVSAFHAAASSTSADAFVPSPISSTVSPRPDAADALDSLRILLAPVIARQRERAEAAAGKRREKAGLGKGARDLPVPLNIPLHGPRVEVVLAWLGAVHLPELDV